MKIVIDISDEGYDWIKNGFPDNEDKEFLIKAVKNGTVIAPTEKAKVGELIDAYTKGFDAGVEIARNEKPQGEWKVKALSTFPQYQPDEYICPFCNTIVNYKTNFCHNCGAQLKGVTDNG